MVSHCRCPPALPIHTHPHGHGAPLPASLAVPYPSRCHPLAPTLLSLDLLRPSSIPPAPAPQPQAPARILPVPSGSFSWDMEMRMPSCGHRVSGGTGRVTGGGGRRRKGSYPLLLLPHSGLQRVRHVAHRQHHMADARLRERGSAGGGAAPAPPAPRAPTCRRASSWWSSTALLQNSTSGFGRLRVSGRSRVPKPPTRISARIPRVPRLTPAPATTRQRRARRARHRRAAQLRPPGPASAGPTARPDTPPRPGPAFAGPYRPPPTHRLPARVLPPARHTPPPTRV